MILVTPIIPNRVLVDVSPTVPFSISCRWKEYINEWMVVSNDLWKIALCGLPVNKCREHWTPYLQTSHRRRTAWTVDILVNSNQSNVQSNQTKLKALLKVRVWTPSHFGTTSMGRNGMGSTLSLSTEPSIWFGLRVEEFQEGYLVPRHSQL